MIVLFRPYILMVHVLFIANFCLYLDAHISLVYIYTYIKEWI